MSNATTIHEPPYYAVIFTSKGTGVDKGYGTMAEKMVALASNQKGFLGLIVFGMMS